MVIGMSEINISFGVRIDDLRERERKVREGLKFIIKHLDDSMPVWTLGSGFLHVLLQKEKKNKYSGRSIAKKRL